MKGTDKIRKHEITFSFTSYTGSGILYYKISIITNIIPLFGTKSLVFYLCGGYERFTVSGCDKVVCDAHELFGLGLSLFCLREMHVHLIA